MTVYFAAARSATSGSPLVRALTRGPIGHVANDDGEPRDDDHLLRAALLEFAAHGLGAARKAKEQAEQAREGADDSAFEYWYGVCRTLDRRLARELAPPDSEPLPQDSAIA